MKTIGFCLLGYYQEIGGGHRSETGESPCQRLLENSVEVSVRNPHMSSSRSQAVAKLPLQGCLPPSLLLLRGPVDVQALLGSDKTISN